MLKPLGFKLKHLGFKLKHLGFELHPRALKWMNNACETDTARHGMDMSRHWNKLHTFMHVFRERLGDMKIYKKSLKTSKNCGYTHILSF